MPIKLTEVKNGQILEVAVSGKLTDEDYQHFIPEFDRLAKQHGKIRVLFEMSQFHGWEIKAAWDDLKLGIRHYRDIELLAFVGEAKWQQWMAAFCRPFTEAQVRYYRRADEEKARLWLGETRMTAENT